MVFFFIHQRNGEKYLGMRPEKLIFDINSFRSKQTQSKKRYDKSECKRPCEQLGLAYSKHFLTIFNMILLFAKFYMFILKIGFENCLFSNFDLDSFLIGHFKPIPRVCSFKKFDFFLLSDRPEILVLRVKFALKFKFHIKFNPRTS